MHQLYNLIIMLCVFLTFTCNANVGPQKPIGLLASALPVSSSTYAPIVKKAAPAVVSIFTSQKVDLANPLFSNDPFFNFFFGESPDRGGPPGQSLAKSLGSGVIIDATGIVVTCAHVIANAQKIVVRLTDNREFEGDIIAKDLQNDLAAIQLKHVPAGTLLSAVALEEKDVEVGDYILAIGNPFGVGQTVTSGIISAIARNVRGRMLIQTDASINPGNSGGALISMDGNLVGIPNAILSKTGANHGIGFAIPEALIRNLMESVKNGGVIIRPWAGIEVQQLTNDLAATFGLQTPQGVLITNLHASSPALIAGLKQGDVITALNGQNISSPEDFIYRIQSISLGEEIILSVHRSGERLVITFQPIEPPAIPAPDTRVIPASGDFMKDLEVSNLSPALISKYQLPAGTPERGVIITNTRQSILALQLKLNKGDIIEEVNRRRIGSVEELFNELPNLRNEGSLVIRQGTRRVEVKKRP
ncbi:MAG: trypsin-like peptidase domain-containing protein [Candidatus Paracaedibacter sp.]